MVPGRMKERGQRELSLPSIHVIHDELRSQSATASKLMFRLNRLSSFLVLSGGEHEVRARFEGAKIVAAMFVTQ